MAKASNLKNAYKKWFYLFLLSNVVILFLTFTANPYRLAPFQITIPGINDVKPRLYEYQRYVKIFDLAYKKPQTILLGSSRVLWGLDPKNSVLQKYPPVYNAGVLGPPLYEVKEYFDHALVSQPNLKRVVLALDFYEFNAKFDDRELILKDMFRKPLNEIIKQHTNLFFDFRAMGETLWCSLMRKKVMTLREDGRLYPDPLSNRELYKDFFLPNVAQVNKDIKIVKPVATGATSARATGAATTAAIKKEKSPKAGMKDELYVPFTLSNKSLAALRSIIKTCKERNIELYIYFPPILQNGEVIAFHKYGIWKEYEKFQHELAKLHSFWDFTGWHEISLNKDNFVDSSHHIFPIGDIILGKIFGQENSNTPHAFGTYVTTQNVDAHLKAIDREYKTRMLGGQYHTRKKV